ncbi:serine/threonine-protein kinase SBK1-like [Sycon ciliatum]|uniref:serine/threonine-protein kinase SBK1-like n=1 Tax=Sycon ciliatum TaxID=27933 RepID=UPI0031F68FAA
MAAVRLAWFPDESENYFVTPQTSEEDIFVTPPTSEEDVLVTPPTSEEDVFVTPPTSTESPAPVEEASVAPVAAEQGGAARAASAPFTVTVEKPVIPEVYAPTSTESPAPVEEASVAPVAAEQGGAARAASAPFTVTVEKPVIPEVYANTNASWLADQIKSQMGGITQVYTGSIHDDFQVERNLWDMTRTKICLVRAKGENGKLTVIKQHRYQEEDRIRSRDRLLREMVIHRIVEDDNCPFIARLANPLCLYHFKHDSSYGFQMEYLPKRDLFEVVASVPPHERLRLLRDAAKGLRYIHSLGIVHIDLKMENIGVNVGPNRKLIAKLIDFGAAKVIGQMIRPGRHIGNTWQYTCPELTCGKPGELTELSAATDMWSFGVLTVCAMSQYQEPPWKLASLTDRDFDFFFHHLVAIWPQSFRLEPPSLRFSKDEFNHLSPFVNFLVTNLLRIDPERRFCARAVVEVLDEELPYILPRRQH